MPPFSVTRETKINRLNADALDGLDSSSFVRVDEEVPAVSLYSTEVHEAPNLVNAHLSASNEHFDHGNVWDPAADRVAFTIPRSGTYMVSATVLWESNGNGYRRVLLQEANNSTIASVLCPANSTPAHTVQNVSGIWSFGEGDRARVLVGQGSGSTLDVRLTHFQITYVGR